MGERLIYFSVDDAKRENRKLHCGRPMIETREEEGEITNDKKINDRGLQLACEKRGEK
jgi:hypothetical protein